MTSSVKINTIEPEGATTNLVIGQSGQNTAIAGNDIRANVLQDAGGNAIFTSNGSGTMSGMNAGFGSAMVLLSTQTASDASSIEFTSDIDSTYGSYVFKFYDLADWGDVNFVFQGSTDGGTSYNTTWTTTYFYARHTEDDGTATLAYLDSADNANGTGYQMISNALRNDADASLSGELYLWSPSSTTYVTQWYCRTSMMQSSPGAWETFAAGFWDTTSAIDAVIFKPSSGTFDGKIKMWGVK